MTTRPYIPPEDIPDLSELQLDATQGMPLAAELRSVVKEAWSGEIQVRSESHLVGVVVLHRGRIAWAVSSQQHEDLGTFLWRLGRITRDQLSDVRQRFEQHQGTRKLGTLLEEAGLIRRVVLRRCLLLHTRMATSSLMRWEQPSLERVGAERSLDEEMTFELEEVLPELAELLQPNTAADADSLERWDPGNEVLYPLEELSNYLAFAVVSSHGEVVALHSRDPAVRPGELGVFVASALELASRAVASTPCQSVDLMVLECAHGSLLARWVKDSRDHLMILLLRAGTSSDPPKYALTAAGPAIERMIARKTAR